MTTTAPILITEPPHVLRTGNVLQFASPLRQELRVGLERAQQHESSINLDARLPSDVGNSQKITVKLFLQSPAAQASSIRQALFATFNELGVNQIDMLLLLDLGQEGEFHQYWEEAQHMVDLGYVRSIGVIDFDSERLAALLSQARIKPVANQIAIDNLTRGSPSMELLDLCSSNGIKLLAGSSDELAGVREVVQSFGSHSKWLVNYVTQLKCRGVLVNRGYLVDYDTPAFGSTSDNAQQLQ